MHSFYPDFGSFARRAVTLYAAMATAWVVLSDRVLLGVFHDPQTVGPLTATKDCAFVVISSLLLYRALLTQLQRLQQEAETRRIAEQAFNESERRFRETMDFLPTAVAVLDGNGKFTYINDAFIACFGYDRGDLPDATAFYELAYPDEVTRAHVRETWRAEVDEAVRGSGLTRAATFAVRCKNGETRDIEFRTRISGAWRITSLVDVSQHLETERRLREQEILLRTCGRLSKVGAWDLDPQTMQSRWSEEVYRIHDLETGVEPTAETSLACFPPRERERIEAAVAAAVREGTPFDLVLEFCSTKGQRKWVRSISEPVFEDGRIVLLRGALQDVTERKTHELEIKRLARLNATLGRVNASIFHATSEAGLLQEICDIAATHGSFHDVTIGTIDNADVGILARAGQADEAGKEMATVCLPIRREGRPWGQFSVTTNATALGSREAALLSEMAADISFALDNLDREKRRRETEDALQRRERRLSAVLRTALSGFWLVDNMGRIVEANESYARMTGYTMEELLSLRICDLEANENPQQVQKRLAAIRQQGGVLFESRHRRKDGSEFDVEVSVNYMPEDGGQYVAFIRDISDRKRALEALQQRVALQQRLERLADAVPGTFFTLERCADGHFSLPYASASLVDLCGVTADKVSHDFGPVFAITHPDDLPRVTESLIASVQGAARWHCEFRITHPSRGNLWLEATAVVHHAPGGSVEWHGYIADVSERKRAEERLRQLSQAVEQSPVSIVIANRAGVIEYANPSFERITGWPCDEVRGSLLTDLKSDEAGPSPPWSDVASGATWQGEIYSKKRDGTSLAEFATLSPVFLAGNQVSHILAFLEDLTDRRSLEAQYRQSQKMEAIGRLAGGVAHDFNNILTVISGYLDYLTGQPTMPPAFVEPLEQIGAASERAATLTRQLLTFSRRQPMTRRTLELNQALSSMTRMLQRLLGEDIVVEVLLCRDPVYLEADAGLLDQVIMNLAVNARDATPAGGRIVIETSTVVFDALSHRQVAHSGSFACLTITDTGCGISPGILPRIFEPFFTTKAVGHGTGLGLATVHGIVAQHNGWIDVESQVARGTTFRVYFPLATCEEIKTTSVASAPSGGTETILLVEDNDAVRKLTSALLVSLGYRVIEASSGVQALEMWPLHQHHVSLLLTDIVMPEGMNGVELASRLKQDGAPLRVVYMSGYSEVSRESLGGATFIDKPFTRARLASAVRSALDA